MALLGLAAVLFICTGCYLLGEVCDQKEDRNTLAYGRSRFAGGTLLVAQGALPAPQARTVAWAMFGLAAISGAGISWFHASTALFGLGVFGAASAALYSLPPVRLVQRGLGELFAGACYGWLPLTTGYACAAGRLPACSPALCLPIAFSVFNVILVNEFPDYEADRDAGKRNLPGRVGKVWGARMI